VNNDGHLTGDELIEVARYTLRVPENMKQRVLVSARAAAAAAAAAAHCVAPGQVRRQSRRVHLVRRVRQAHAGVRCGRRRRCSRALTRPARRRLQGDLSEMWQLKRQTSLVRVASNLASHFPNE
jgi:hypothetical protein